MEERAFDIREATRADAAPLLAIYRPFVEESSVSFETDVPSLEEYSARIDKALTSWAWLVAERNGQCIGSAYGSRHRERTAYQWSVEVSVYVQPRSQRRGVGRALYDSLLENLAHRGFCNAYAGITLPNDASVALHSAVGFTPVGIFESVGRKFGVWHDVAWFQKRLRDSPPQLGQLVSPGG
jgi:L-amino acid N-acyltransferase YncA